MAEQNSTSTSAQNSSPKGGVSAESEFHAKFFPHPGPCCFCDRSAHVRVLLPADYR